MLYDDKFKELINLDSPSRELLQSIIDKIAIDKNIKKLCVKLLTMIVITNL